MKLKYIYVCEETFIISEAKKKSTPIDLTLYIAQFLVATCRLAADSDPNKKKCWGKKVKVILFPSQKLYTVCPGSSDPFYLVSCYIKWVTLPGHTVAWYFI